MDIIKSINEYGHVQYVNTEGHPICYCCGVVICENVHGDNITCSECDAEIAADNNVLGEANVEEDQCELPDSFVDL